MRQNQKKKCANHGNSRKKEKGTESIFKPIMTEKLSNLGAEINTQSQGA